MYTDRHIKVDADDLLAAKTTGSDIKKLFTIYRKLFIIAIIAFVLLVFFSILNMNGRGYRAIVLLAVWAVVVGDLLRRIIVPQRKTIKKYKDSIEKYGKDNIKREMTSGFQEVYYMFEGRYETYVVVTNSYLVMVNGIVFSWDDMDGIDFVHRHIDASNLTGVNLDDQDKETMANMREMKIKKPDGSVYPTLIALHEDDFNEFFVTLCDRFPGKTFSSK